MTSKSEIDYVFVALPLIASHVLVPPLSYFTGERLGEHTFWRPIFDFIYQYITPEYFNGSSMQSRSNVMALGCKCQVDRDGNMVVVDEGNFPASMVTYMLVHGDYRHLFNNLVGAVVHGKRVSDEFTPFGMYALYILGGIVAVSPSPLHRYKNTRPLSVAVSDDLTSNAYAKKGIGMLMDAVSSIKKLQPFVNIGSSGAVWALRGMSEPKSIRSRAASIAIFAHFMYVCMYVCMHACVRACMR
jgi:membrane associated rhomboid family serine protease